NPVDIRIASGTFYGGSPPLPSVAGREGVGRTAEGELVYFDAPAPPYGSFAERAPVVRDSEIPLPAEIDPALAVALGIAGLAALGHTNFMAPPDVKRGAYQRMVEHAAAGELKVDVERVPLEDVAEAWQRQQHSPHHKLVVVP